MEAFVVLHSWNVPIAVVIAESKEEAIRKFAKSKGLDEEVVKKLICKTYTEVRKFSDKIYTFVETKVIQ